MMAGLTIANIIGVPFGTIIGQQFGWRASFGAVVVMGILSLIGIIALIPVIAQEKASTLGQEVRALMQPRLLLVLLTGALGCSSLFTVFTYIAPLLEQVTGISEHGVAGMLILFGVGVTIGNIVGGKLADWKLMPTVLAGFAVLALILAAFGLTDRNPLLAAITIFVWGVASFSILPGLQIRIMNMAQDAPSLASTSNHSALNLGNAGGAFLGGWVIIHYGLPTLPWIASIITVIGFFLALTSYRLERSSTSSAKS
jgi:DHA1 family inner membrane transport protein